MFLLCTAVKYGSGYNLYILSNIYIQRFENTQKVNINTNMLIILWKNITNRFGISEILQNAITNKNNKDNLLTSNTNLKSSFRNHSTVIYKPDWNNEILVHNNVSHKSKQREVHLYLNISKVVDCRLIVLLCHTWLQCNKEEKKKTKCIITMQT